MYVNKEGKEKEVRETWDKVGSDEVYDKIKRSKRNDKVGKEREEVIEKGRRGRDM